MNIKTVSDSIQDIDTSSIQDINDNVPKFYVMNNYRYINPSYINKNIYTRIIDTWPAHSSGRLFPTRQILVTNNHRVRVLDEHESRLPNLVPKPKFLQILESHIKNQLAINKVTEVKPDKTRLNIYSSAFEWLLKALKSYKPLFMSIKREYEMNISHLRAELKKVEPMKELLWTLSHEYDTIVNDMINSEPKDMVELKEETRRILNEIHEIQLEKKSLKSELIKLTEELEKESLLYRTVSDSKKILVADMNEIRSKLKEMEKLAKRKIDVLKEDRYMLRWGLEQSKKTLAKANSKIMSLESVNSNIVPRKEYDQCYKELTEVKDQLNNAIDENICLHIEMENLDSTCHNLHILRDRLCLKFKRMMAVPEPSPSPSTKSKKQKSKEDESEVLEDEINKWTQIAANVPHAELVKKIEAELKKTDGSAELMLEVLNVLFNN